MMLNYLYEQNIVRKSESFSSIKTEQQPHDDTIQKTCTVESNTQSIKKREAENEDLLYKYVFSDSMASGQDKQDKSSFLNSHSVTHTSSTPLTQAFLDSINPNNGCKKEITAFESSSPYYELLI